tara:strand:+ start:45 stop:332 length:288 start_codon:yes stop_codon:yes gene_type:complete
MTKLGVKIKIKANLDGGILRIVPNEKPWAFLWKIVLPPGEELPLNCHSPQEIYVIRQGEVSSLTTKKFYKDSFVYIPKNFEHGLTNTFKQDLVLL